MDFTCPHCAQNLEGDDDLSGATVDCPKCGKTFTIPPLGFSARPVPLNTPHRTVSTTGHNVPKQPKSRKSFWWTLGSVGAVLASGMISFGLYALVKYQYRKAEERKAYQQQKDAYEFYVKGLNYYFGNDAQQDYSQAMEYFQYASDMGNPAADGYLASIYYLGQGNVKQDTNHALRYAMKAGDNRSEISNVILGDCYLFGFKDDSGKDVQDFDFAYECYCNAADSGSWFRDYGYSDAACYGSMLMKGLMQFSGVGTQEDRVGAAKTFYRCCHDKPKDSSAARAAMCLAFLYESGIGVAKNQIEADKWFAWGWENGGRISLKQHNPGGVLNLLLTSVGYYYTKQAKMR